MGYVSNLSRVVVFSFFSICGLRAISGSRTVRVLSSGPLLALINKTALSGVRFFEMVLLGSAARFRCRYGCQA